MIQKENFGFTKEILDFVVQIEQEDIPR